MRDMHFRSGNEIRIMDVRDDESNGQDKPVVDYLDYGYTMNDFDLTLDKIIKGRLNVDDVVKRHRRVRRSVTKKDSIEHVTKIMESIEEELDDLKVRFGISTLSLSVQYYFAYRRAIKRPICNLLINSKLKFVTHPR